MARNPNRPRIVLCGSSRFMDDHQKEMKRLTLEGAIVIGMGMFGHQEPGFDMSGEVKRDLDDLHLDKIDWGTRVHVVNGNRHWCPRCKEWKDHGHFDRHGGDSWRVCTHLDCKSRLVLYPYVGDSTKREIAYAREQGKHLTWMQEHRTPDGKVFVVVTRERRVYKLTYRLEADDRQHAIDGVLGSDSPEPVVEEFVDCLGEEDLVSVEEVTDAPHPARKAEAGG
jgi:hypothetical protein